MRMLRKQRGLTMKALGRMVGVSESTISLYENGKHDPDLVTLNRIADALQVTSDELLGRETAEKKEAAGSGSMRESIMRLYDAIPDLTDEEAAFLLASIEGIKAARKL